VAIMERHGVAEIMTFDRGFADRPGIRVVGG
jgi:predicted nucleic acid-binding protein